MMVLIVSVAVTAVIAFRWPQKAVWGLLVFLPFQIAFNPFPSVDLLAGRVMIPAVAMGVLFALWRRREPLRPSSLVWMGVAASLMGTFSSLWALNETQALQRSLVWWSLLPMVVLLEWLLSFPEEREKIPSVLGALVIVVSVVALVPMGAALLGGGENVERILLSVAPFVWGSGFAEQIVAHPSWFVELGKTSVLRAFFPFPDPHMLAFFLAAALPVAIIRRTSYSISAGVIGGVALIATFSRGGYLGALVAVVAAALLAWRQLSVTHRRLTVGLFATLLVFLLVPNSVTARFWSSFDLTEGSVAGRIETMRESLSIIGDNVFTGVGLGNYAQAISPLSSLESPLYAHNSYLDVAAQLGVPFLVSLIVAFVILLSRHRTRFFEYRKNPLLFGGFCSFLWVLTHALFETPLFSPRVLPFLFIGAVILFSSRYTDHAYL